MYYDENVIEEYGVMDENRSSLSNESGETYRSTRFRFSRTYEVHIKLI